MDCLFCFSIWPTTVSLSRVRRRETAFFDLPLQLFSRQISNCFCYLDLHGIGCMGIGFQCKARISVVKHAVDCSYIHDALQGQRCEGMPLIVGGSVPRRWRPGSSRWRCSTNRGTAYRPWPGLETYKDCLDAFHAPESEIQRLLWNCFFTDGSRCFWRLYLHSPTLHTYGLLRNGDCFVFHVQIRPAQRCQFPFSQARTQFQKHHHKETSAVCFR